MLLVSMVMRPRSNKLCKSPEGASRSMGGKFEIRNQVGCGLLQGLLKHHIRR